MDVPAPVLGRGCRGNHLASRRAVLLFPSVKPWALGPECD
jgi:hypothetical protein